MKKILLLVIVSFLVLGGVFIFLKESNYLVIPQSQKEILEVNVTNNQIPKVTEEAPARKEQVLPARFKLKVPFTSQAPFAIWDDDHNNACEEAAILMVQYFYSKSQNNSESVSLTPETADREILRMIEYQKKNWKGHYDLESKEVAKLAEEFYGYKNAKVKYNISLEDIKREIVAGHPVILPCAGRELGNPYYRRPGPLYHMLVAIGYQKDEIIVNDPGTKRGKDFRYKNKILLDALHEWNGGDVQNGRSAMIILYP